MLASLPGDVSAVEVTVDCSDLRAGAQSFVDELVKVVLVERSAARLLLAGAPQRAQRYAQRSAANRSVGSRLGLAPQPAGGG